MNLFDLHCDTPYELFKRQAKLYDNSLHISLKKAKCFDKYVQCAAVWSDNTKSDKECRADFFKIVEYFENELSRNSISLIKSNDDIEKSERGFILTVEDARIVENNTEFVYTLFNKGVRIMTLVWKDVSQIGGAYNTDKGLSDFGKEVLKNCFNSGIIPDISHASDRLAFDVIDIAEKLSKPVALTHSDSRSVYNHPRNASDEIARRVSDLGGLVGINLCPNHLTKENASINDILSHIEHYVSVIGEKHIALGCDFDGIETTPDGVNDISDVQKLYPLLGEYADAIFFGNAYNFVKNHIHNI